MKGISKQSIRAIRQALLSKSPNQVSTVIGKLLEQLPPQNPNWTENLYQHLGYQVIDGYLAAPAPRDLANALKAQNLQAFYDSFVLLACRARKLSPNAETLEALLAELQQKDMTDYTDIDANIVPLVKALNTYPEVTTVGSCGGHQTITNPSQWTQGSWFVKFEIAPTSSGWYVLEFLAWAINEDFRHACPQVTLLPTAPPPYLNTPGCQERNEMGSFDILMMGGRGCNIRRGAE